MYMLFAGRMVGIEKKETGWLRQHGRPFFTFFYEFSRLITTKSPHLIPRQVGFGLRCVKNVCT